MNDLKGLRVSDIKILNEHELLEKKHADKVIAEAKSYNSKLNKEVNEMETEEIKTYVVKCTNEGPKRCGFRYDTNDAPDESHKHKQCQVCNKPTTHSEKE